MEALNNSADTLSVVRPADVQMRTPMISALDVLGLCNRDNFPAMAYQDGTVLVEKTAWESNPFLYTKIEQEINAGGVAVKEVLFAQPHLIAEELRRAWRIQREKDDVSEEDTEAQKLLETVVRWAVEHRSSDIHIFARKDDPAIYYRLDGDIWISTPIPTKYDEILSMLARAFNWDGANNASSDFDLKSISDTTLSLELTAVQGGRTVTVPVRLRLEKGALEQEGDLNCVIRVSPETTSKSLEELGIAKKMVNYLASEMRRPNGMILVTGPTGSGKTTFLHGCLHYAPKTKTITTIEDPVELRADYNPLIAQHNLDPSVGYSGQLRSLLRKDPDIIVIGEMRDNETAKIAVKSALTGHLVLTTLHTNSCATIPVRLNDMGVSFAFQSYPGVLNSLVATRLVPVSCPHCSTALKEDSPYWSKLSPLKRAKTKQIKLINPDGCEHCRDGKAGRTPIMEVLVIDDKARQYLREGDVDGLMAYAIENGFRSLTDMAWEKINQGILCPTLAENVIEGILNNGQEAFDYEAIYE